MQGGKNLGRQVAWTTKLCAVAPNICQPKLWNWHHVIFLVPRTLRWPFTFMENLFTPDSGIPVEDSRQILQFPSPATFTTVNLSTNPLIKSYNIVALEGYSMNVKVLE